MLIEFNVSNYKSLAEKVCMSMLPSRGASHLHRTGSNYYPEALKVAALYGPNGAGKSNVVGALSNLQIILQHSAKTNSTTAMPYSPFVYDSSLRRSPTIYEVIFSFDEVVWRYRLSHDRHKIHQEELFARNHETSVERTIFTRSLDAELDVTEIYLGPSIRKHRKLLVENTNLNQSFLSKLDQFGEAEVRSAYLWLTILLRPIQSIEHFPKSVTAEKLSEAAYKTAIMSFLEAVGIPLQDISVDTNELDVSMDDDGYSFVSDSADAIYTFNESFITRINFNDYSKC